MSLGSLEKEAFEEAVQKLGDTDSIGADYFRTDTRRRHSRFPWQEGRRTFPLLAHYFKIGFRKIKRQKLYSLINITGLAVGLACCAVIILYVANELTYDQFHPEAGRDQLIRQFLGESFLITLAAFVVASGLAYALLIPFNRMAGTELSFAGLGRPAVLLSLLGLLLCVGLGSGFYPAVILTAFKPMSVLQGKSAPALRGSLMQKLLVVGQFAISIFLVICTLTVFRQLGFMKGSALGFNPDQKLVLRVKSLLPHLRQDYETIKRDFLQ